MTVSTAGFIPRSVSRPRGQDFNVLRNEGLGHIERLAHDVWTDYNIHDPGITLLELMAYAITDLGRRAAYPVRDILTEIRQGVAISTGDFHLAHQVLVCNPVSFDDLRKLLIDIPGVRNAWIERHESVTCALDAQHHVLRDPAPFGLPEAAFHISGLFDVFLEYEEFVSGTDPVFRSEAHVGLADNANTGGYIAPDAKGIDFTAVSNSRLRSVVVYADESKDVTIRLTDSLGNELAKSPATPAQKNTATRVTLNFELVAGKNYRLDAKGTTVKLYRDTDVTYPKGLDKVITLTGGNPTAGHYFFFYDWVVAYDPTGLTKGEVRTAAIERIHSHRNLCEDVINVCGLNPEEIAVCADVELAPEADTAAVQAEILYLMHHHVAPAVRFHSIDELVRRGRTMDEIFQGPLLDHGFIDDAEFRAIRRQCEIRTSDVVQLIMDIAGVVAVKNIRLLSFIDGKLRLQADWLLPLSADRFRIAAFSPDRSKLIFYKRGLPYYANRKLVETLLKEKKATDVEAKLKGHVRELPVPVGEARELAEYYPVQNELPMTYCVGRIRVPQSETPLRKAQSRQLRAYLMFYEQILVNFLAQLAHTSDLFTWRGTERATYFTEEVQGILDFADLDNAAYRATKGWGTFLEGLKAIIESPADADKRRIRLLDHLAARYSEAFDEYAALMRAMPAYAAPARLIADERAFLHDYPAVGFARGTGFDWRWPDLADNVSGYQRRVYRLLGISDVTRHQSGLSDVIRHQLAGHRFVIVEVTTGGVSQWHFELHGVAQNGDPPVLFKSISCETKSAIEGLLDHALELGGDATNYVAPTAGANFQLMQRCAPDQDQEAIGTVRAGVPLADVVAYFDRYERSEGFHLIEHVLLRRRIKKDPFLPVQVHRVDDPCGCPEALDPYSFRVSIVLPSWSPRFRDTRFRRLVEDTLRREAPAHVYARICWVNHDQMRELEVALEDWQAKLAALASQPAECDSGDQSTRTGLRPLPPSAGDEDTQYTSALQRLIAILYGLTTVYPLARLHACEEATSDAPQVTLNNTSLGTL